MIFSQVATLATVTVVSVSAFLFNTLHTRRSAEASVSVDLPAGAYYCEVRVSPTGGGDVGPEECTRISKDGPAL